MENEGFKSYWGEEVNREFMKEEGSNAEEDNVKPESTGKRYIEMNVEEQDEADAEFERLHDIMNDSNQSVFARDRANRKIQKMMGMLFGNEQVKGSADMETGKLPGKSYEWDKGVRGYGSLGEKMGVMTQGKKHYRPDDPKGRKV